jgi:RND superfamily putative drug exporter
MARVTSFAVRRSKLVIGAWIAIVFAFAALGTAGKDSFAPPSMFVAGTESARWAEMTEGSDFGENVSVLLTGPDADLREQGTVLAAKLRGISGVRVVSPFDKVRTSGSSEPDNPFTNRQRDTALLAVDVTPPENAAPGESAALVRRVIATTVEDPVSSRVTGPAAVAKGINDELLEAMKRSEMIAAPLLMLVLLLIFRSPVAAAVPLILGIGTVQASKGIIQLLATQFAIDQMAVNVASMMALALGVDYSLLLASRYREYRRENPVDVRANIERAGRATGRTIVTAATLVIAVMAVALLLALGIILKSVLLGVVVATLFGAFSALVVAPALLHVLDPWLERWRLPERRRRRARGGSPFARPMPIAVPLVALLGLLVLATPTLGISPGAPDVKLLPADNEARVDYEQISKVVGPGIGAMFDVAIEARDGRPITDRKTLASIARLQRDIAADPRIATAIGPGLISTMTRPLNGLEASLSEQSRDLARLSRGLGRSADGARDASGGATQIQAGAGDARAGAAEIDDGIRAAANGSRRISDGLTDSSDGGEQIATGSQQASEGAAELSGALDQASDQSGATVNNARVLANDLRTGEDQLTALQAPLTTAEQQLDAAWAALQSMGPGREDPRYQATVDAVSGATVAVTGTDPATGDRPDPAYGGVAEGVADAKGQIGLGLYLSDRMESQSKRSQRGLDRLARGANRLDSAVAKLADGAGELERGLDELAAAGVRLPEGLARLSGGADELVAGIQDLGAGSGELAGRIGTTGSRGTLVGGLDRMHASVDEQRSESQANTLTRDSPELFSSGAFPLAVVSGTPGPTRERAQFVLDMTNGGRSARILAVPAFEMHDDRTLEVHERLTDLAAKAAGPQLATAVGGPVADVQDYRNALVERLPLVLLAFALVSLIVLMFAVRSVPLALICVVLNILTVGVAFGVMQITFGQSPPLLGGPGRVDLISMFGALAVVFALSIDYQVFLLARIREEYLRTGDNERAITAAIGSTGSVITGAAAVMVGVFLASALTSHIGVRQVGVGLAVAVLLDATVVRLVLLPAAMRIVGERVWWFPDWLDRRVPNVSL